MKRIITLILISLISLSLFAQSVAEASIKPNATQVRVAAMKGPTAMGLVKLMDESKAGIVNGNSYSFEIIASPSEMTPKLVKGDVDIAALPANLASIVYNNTKGKIKVLAVNTLGVLYIVENGNKINSLSDLKGKTIYSAGKGSSPEYVLMYLLSKSGMEVGKDVFVEWKSEHAECVAAITSKENSVALIPEPFVTTALLKKEGLRSALDLNKVWNEYLPGTELITGVIVGRESFINEHKESVDAFLSSYADSVKYVNENIEEGAKLIALEQIVPASVAKIAIPKCNIVHISGEKLKTVLPTYLEVLFNANPKSIGGAIPSEDFYY